MTPPEPHNEILDASGRPLPNRPTWRGRWTSISSKTRVILVSCAAIVAVAAALITQIETIGRFFSVAPQAPSVPDIRLNLTNSGDSDVAVMTRGDFILWLGGADAQHTFGKYEILPSKESSQIVVKPSKTLSVSMRIMNQELFGQVLTRGDCDLSVIVRRAEGGIVISDGLMPFTLPALQKYSFQVDVAPETSNKALDATAN